MDKNKPHRRKPSFIKRRNIYIKKRFQADFSIKFLVLIVVEALMAIALFGYLSRGTVITGYSGNELVIAKTGEYFLPAVLLVNLVVIGVTAAAGFLILLVLSHRIAGPLYRFEKSLDEMEKGDLTHRFTLRSKDQMGELADKINMFNSRMEQEVAKIQRGIDGLGPVLSELEKAIESDPTDKARIQELSGKASEKLRSLEETANYFKTSGRPGK